MTAEPSSIWVNGERQRGGLRVSAARGFMLADGVFETMRARRYSLPLGAHLARLRRSHDSRDRFWRLRTLSRRCVRPVGATQRPADGDAWHRWRWRLATV